MNINATLLGQIYMAWCLLYLATCFFISWQFKLPKVVNVVAILLVPFIPLTGIYLMVLTVLGIRGKQAASSDGG